MTNTCPCLSGINYHQCCNPLHLGQRIAVSPEELMRSRYCAFVKADAQYIFATHSPSTRSTISIDSIEQWNQQCQWLGLTIKTISRQKIYGFVEFVAWYKQNNQLAFHHEISRFKQQPIDSVLATRLSKLHNEESWYFLDATYPDNVVKLPQRNDQCICGSKNKFKKCCGR